MSSLGIALIVSACLFASALFGMFLSALLPRDHLSQDSKHVVNVSMGLIATMSALVLGLLISSAKGSFDQENSLIQQGAAKIIQLDRVLAHYGPETKEIRERLRRAVAFRIHLTWPEEGSTPAVTGTTPAMTRTAEGLEESVRKLSPQTDVQRELQSRALQLTQDILGSRWMMFVESLNPMPTAFLVVLVLWLCMLFAGFGLFAPRNATVLLAFVLCAVAVSSALFLILEMNHPFHGLIKISDEPLRYALSQLGQ
jgi:hypothetical protein